MALECLELERGNTIVVTGFDLVYRNHSASLSLILFSVLLCASISLFGVNSNPISTYYIYVVVVVCSIVTNVTYLPNVTRVLR